MIRVRFKLKGEDFFDTYKDETVTHKLKVSDFSKIDTNYGDYTFSIYLPATNKNLDLIQFYNNTQVINAFNPFVEKECEMWVNQTKLTDGVFKLLSIKQKNKIPTDIQIQFFGKLTSLKSRLTISGGSDNADSKLKDLDWSGFNHSILQSDVLNYLSGGTVLNSSGVDTGLKYVMASQSNKWRWKNLPQEGQRRISVSAQNFTGSDTDIGIRPQEVRPAVKVSVVMDKIFALAGVNYNVDFAAKEYYDDLWMWVGNGEELEKADYSNTLIRDINSQLTSGLNGSEWNFLPYFNSNTIDTYNSYNPSTGRYTAPIAGAISVKVNGNLNISLPAFAKQWRAVENVGGVITTLPWMNLGVSYSFNPSSTNDYLEQFEVKATNVVPPAEPQATLTGCQLTASTPSIGVNEFNFTKFIPDIECTKFISGILKTFNAVLIYDKDNDIYNIKHKNNYYREGVEVDLTKYIDTSQDVILPPTFYKHYNLNFEKAKDFLNTRYVEYAQGMQWGSDVFDIDYKYGEDYDLDSPFTATIWQEVVSVASTSYPSIDVDTLVPSFQSVSDKGESVDAGVRLMYDNGIQASQTYTVSDADGLNPDPTGAGIINQFTAVSPINKIGFSFSQEMGWNVDLNLQQSQVDMVDNLFTKFYKNYLSNIYTAGTRKYQIKMRIGYLVATTINLNDIVVIQGKKYFINTLEINYNTGEAKLELIDWMDFEAI